MFFQNQIKCSFVVLLTELLSVQVSLHILKVYKMPTVLSFQAFRPKGPNICQNITHLFHGLHGYKSNLSNVQTHMLRKHVSCHLHNQQVRAHCTYLLVTTDVCTSQQLERMHNNHKTGHNRAYLVSHKAAEVKKNNDQVELPLLTNEASTTFHRNFAILC